jgi:hypothetical protein
LGTFCSIEDSVQPPCDPETEEAIRLFAVLENFVNLSSMFDLLVGSVIKERV